jgi:hypothetical protein
MQKLSDTLKENQKVLMVAGAALAIGAGATYLTIKYGSDSKPSQ